MNLGAPTVHTQPRKIHRIGRVPDPWAWSPWQYGPFTGRWDDPLETYRVIYTGASRYACLLEVLAGFRPDPALIVLHSELDESAGEGHHQDLPPGVVPRDWVSRRAAGSATLAGSHIAIGTAATLSWLRPRIARLLNRHGLDDIDGGTVRQSARGFTRDLSRWLHEHTDPILDGVEFDSRHGNRLVLWATFERASDGESSRHLVDRGHEPLSANDPALRRALERHHLTIAG